MPSVVSLRWRYGASRLCHFCGGDAYVWGCGGFRHAVGSVAGNFVGGGDWKPRDIWALRLQRAVGGGLRAACRAALQPCGRSAYIVNMKGKIRRKEYKTLYSDKGGSRGIKKKWLSPDNQP